MSDLATRQADLKERFRPRTATEIPQLTEAETLVCQEVINGLEDEAIAKKLKCSVRRVQDSVLSICAKFGIRSERGLFPMVVAAGMELRTGKLIAGIQ